MSICFVKMLSFILGDSAKVLGRRSMREQRMPSVTLTDEHENTKVLDEKTEQTTIKEDSRQLEYPGSSDNLDDLVYHVDYHGVTTHPTPKHPEP
ncbi:hypothetical protein OIU77_029951 [Salix suchowensis]|uniref:Uncharacterized protein n=1 Tax=Salix suchowensis TaxID=1278906 RepID=A0ABQ9BDI6_9ROSI|nr:hypothetical protein OIU77_029951 [Salix suchowensis]